MKLQKSLKMLMVSSYPPRECGLATFSQDIVNAIKTVFGSSLAIEICALHNRENKCSYNQEVSYTISTSNLVEYQLTAEEINERKDIGLVCIQHEFGLFGGEYGEYILPFILALNKPIATVFHTILPNPDEKRKKIVRAITDLSDKIIVLTKKSQELLVTHYDCSPTKIQIIPHGNHSIQWEQKEQLKTDNGFSNTTVLSTFGLISENKNIETTLFALSEIVAQHPKVVYFIIGATHPDVISREGEKYRNKLITLVEDLGLDKHVVFVNEYLELKKLLEYLTLSDIYLLSSKDPNQAVSGTFAYAMSCGCAVISTPIPHAVESLEDCSGIVLDSFDKPENFKDAILWMIENKEKQIAMGRNAFCLSHGPRWENIAIQYGMLFADLTNKHEDLRFCLPPINMGHIKKLTTDRGILQFSNFSEPDPSSGYTLDDNARALIDMVMYNKLFPHDDNLKMANIYLKYIEEIQRENGWFDNYKDFEYQLTKQNEEVNLEDANGRALWSLGTVFAHKESLPDVFLERAKVCWDKAIVKLPDISSPRAMAYAIKGLFNYYSTYKEAAIEKHIERLADELLRHYQINSDEKWCWYEDYMTYANNVLPEAMMFSYLVTGKMKYKKIAIITFDFLLSHYFMKGQLKVISNRTWFKKENERTFYGEQPIEVATTIITLDLFNEVTRNRKYREQLKLAFIWFLGDNHLKQIMYNPENGASYDGLEDTHININQGAESTLCFFKARLIMEKYAE